MADQSTPETEYFLWITLEPEWAPEEICFYALMDSSEARIAKRLCTLFAGKYADAPDLPPYKQADFSYTPVADLDPDSVFLIREKIEGFRKPNDWDPKTAKNAFNNLIVLLHDREMLGSFCFQQASVWEKRLRQRESAAAGTAEPTATVKHDGTMALPAAPPSAPTEPLAESARANPSDQLGFGKCKTPSYFLVVSAVRALIGPVKEEGLTEPSTVPVVTDMAFYKTDVEVVARELLRLFETNGPLRVFTLEDFLGVSPPPLYQVQNGANLSVSKRVLYLDSIQNLEEDISRDQRAVLQGKTEGIAPLREFLMSCRKQARKWEPLVRSQLGIGEHARETSDTGTADLDALAAR